MEEREEMDEESETLMYEVVFKSGRVLRCELPLDDMPTSKEELALARNTSPVIYWTGVILDWRDISGCAPDYSAI